jgi:glucokinase
VDIAQPISDKYRVHCMVENDAVAAAFAENRIGSSTGFHSALMITLGTGVGVSMIQSGVPVRGADGVHPESGHMTVNPVFGAAPCYCGRSVCWEQMASRTSLQTSASALFSSGENAIESIGIAHKAALAGDAKALQLFDRYGIAIAQGLANLLTIYRPPCVVIGGAGAQYFDLFIASLRATLDLHVGVFPDFTLLPATLGDFGGAIGAALMANTQNPKA